ncbi:Heme chaperone HemW [Azospirillaceae bacterium]
MRDLCDSQIKRSSAFGIYIHWPFCLSKCPYCDFNSAAIGSSSLKIEQYLWLSACRDDLTLQAALTPGRTVTSIFFGGGSPSLMEPATVGAILDHIATLWPIAASVETTLEANPTSVEATRFSAYRAAGINRLSLGMQALDDDALKRLGRGHDAAEAERALTLAQRHFPRVSADIIYARPDQTAAAWREELDRLLAYGLDHLSAYQLTIEPGTAYHERSLRGEPLSVDDERAGELYEITQEVLEAAGLPAYEISNHARSGEACRHNLIYWRSEEWIGVGPGAHGRITCDGRRVALWRPRSLIRWRAQIERRTSVDQEVLTPIEWRDEVVMMGLRLTEGVARNCLPAALPEVPLRRLQEGGFLVSDSVSVRATSVGRQRLNAVLVRLLDDQNKKG